MRVLRFVGVFRATLDSVSCRMAVSATGSSPLERRLLSEWQKQTYIPTIEIDHNREQHYTHVYVNVQRLSVVFSVFNGRFLNASTGSQRSWSSAFLLYHVTPQLVAYSALHLLCKTRPFSLRDSLLELGLLLTSDSTTGFFSVTSTLDGEHRGDSPAAKYFVTVSSKICRNQISLSLSLSPHQYSTHH